MGIAGQIFCDPEETPTLLTVSLTAGTGRRGRDVWKLYSMGFRPEKSLTIPLKKKFILKVETT